MTTHPYGAEALSVALIGLDAHLLHIGVILERGTPKLELVGSPEGQAREPRVRVRAALQHIGVDVYERSLPVHATPDHLPKSGALDVAIALAVLGAMGQLPT